MEIHEVFACQFLRPIVTGLAKRASHPHDIFLHCDILLNGSVAGQCCLVGNTQKGFYHYMLPLTWPEFYLEPCHTMQIIRMDISLEGRGRAKSALILFKQLQFREMGGTSNGPKIHNKISATFRHLNLPCQNAEKVVTPWRTRKLAKKGTCTSLSRRVI